MKPMKVKYSLSNHDMNALHYGEVCLKGMQEILEQFKDEVNDDITFLDIGSGYGKIVTYMAEMGGYNSIGIEISKEKHEIAEKILWTYEKEKVKLIEGDIRDNIELLQSADVIFSNCILFKRETVEWILKNKKNKSIFIQNASSFIGDLKWDKFDVYTSWKKGERSKFYKLNTITKR